jgi:ABC-2 type transport system permease protein
MAYPRSILVARNELATTLRRRSFWIMALLFPLIIIAFSLGSQLIALRPNGESGLPTGGTADTVEVEAVGYVDRSGLIRQDPPNLPPGLLRAFSDETQAHSALTAGEIARYYVLAPDALQTGELVRVEENFRPLRSMDADPLMRYAIVFNLFHDAERAAAYVEPFASIRFDALQGDSSRPAPESGPVARFLPFAVVFILFFVITTTGGFMLQSVAREKENRTAEILLLSVDPRGLMLGKLVGLTVVALIQMAFWIGATALALDQTRRIFSTALDLEIGAVPLVWAALYFALGYLMYASALGALGALAPGSREAGQFTIVVLLPLMAPLMLNSVLVDSPDGTVSTVLSLFPLTSPVTMVARLTATAVPWWQTLAGLLALAATAYVLVALSARFFRPDTLLSGAALSWARLREAVGRSPS